MELTLIGHTGERRRVRCEEEEVEGADVIKEEELGPRCLQVLFTMELHTHACEEERDSTPSADESLKVFTSPPSKAEREEGERARGKEHPNRDERCDQNAAKSAAGRRGRKGGSLHAGHVLCFRAVRVQVHVS
jgi:hypothetical protein